MAERKLRQRDVIRVLNFTATRLHVLRKEGRIAPAGRDGSGFYWAAQAVMDYAANSGNYTEGCQARMRSVLYDKDHTCHKSAGGRPAADTTMKEEA